MRYYCPNCWRDFWNEDFRQCPGCGYKIEDFEAKDYVDKLINALNHRSGEVKHRAIIILAQMTEKRAIPYLGKLVCASEDPSLVKAAEDAVTKISSPDK
jgi:uncharacterized membrane protein YvbJ